MNDPYENLANAIVLQAVKDYRLHDDEQELASIERFFRSNLQPVATETHSVCFSGGKCDVQKL